MFVVAVDNVNAVQGREALYAALIRLQLPDCVNVGVIAIGARMVKYKNAFVAAVACPGVIAYAD
jgi:hypothetical protein